MTTNCPNLKPTHQAQLVYQWGGRYGGSNCTACSAGMVGQVHTCGALRFTGAQIRAATNEPIPDPKSPGLNLGQVDTALFKLSKGAIDLDTHYRYGFDSLVQRVTGGAPAIAQFRRKILIDAGFGGGNSFAGGHAGAIGFDGRLWMDDPLTGLIRPSWGVLERAMGLLVLDAAGNIAGIGKAYVSFGRDVARNYRIRFGPGPAVFEYSLRDGMIWSREAIRFRSTTGAPCRPPRMFLAHPKGPLKGTASRRLAIVTDGFLKGSGFAEKLPVVDIYEVR